MYDLTPLFLSKLLNAFVFFEAFTALIFVIMVLGCNKKLHGNHNQPQFPMISLQMDRNPSFKMPSKCMRHTSMGV